MATVWMTLTGEAVVLLAAAGAAVAWVRGESRTPEPAEQRPVAPLVEQAA